MKRYLEGGVDLLVSFSGGATSAYMSYMLKKESKNKIHVVFANTGQEREETLEFVDKCDKYFNLGVVWVEADIKGKKEGTKHKRVSFETASRKGEPFESMIKKYGIPNKSYPHCTRELKLAPIHSYMASVSDNYLTAIGIRADEYRRCKQKHGIVYPLADEWITSKDDVNRFWALMPFRLNLLEHEGNCSWCWKKSFKKHFRLIRENKKIYDFPLLMEKMYSEYIPRGQYKTGKRRVFFRGNTSTDELLSLDRQMTIFDIIDDGCSESCEILM